MKGSIARRGKGWFCRVYLGRTREGRQRFLTRTIHGSRREAEAELAAMVLEAERLKSRYETAPELQTLGSWLNEWLESRVNLSPSTHSAYERAIRIHISPAIGDIKLRHLTGRGLTAFYSGLDLASRTIEQLHVVLHSALKSAVREGLVTENVADHAELPRRKPGRKVEPPSLEDLARVLEVNEGHWTSFAILLMASTGIRRGEAVGLRWSDIGDGILHVRRSIQVVDRRMLIRPPKSEAGKREIAIPEVLEAALKEYRLSRPLNPLLFPSSHGGLMVPSTFGSAITDAGKRAGVYLTCHMLRHYFASDMLLHEIPPRVAQVRLGHSKIATTLEVYSHVLRETQARASDVSGDLIKFLIKRRNGKTGNSR